MLNKRLFFFVITIFITMLAVPTHAANPKYCFDISITVGAGRVFQEVTYNQTEIIDFVQQPDTEPGVRTKRVNLAPGVFYEAITDVGYVFASSIGLQALGEASISFCGYSEDELLRDGRLNYRDAAARAVVYKTDTGYDIYEIDSNSNGHYAFSISVEEIALAIVQTLYSGTNTPIKTSSSGISSVHWVTNTGCQLNYMSEDGHTREFLFACGLDFFEEIFVLIYGVEPPDISTLTSGG